MGIDNEATAPDGLHGIPLPAVVVLDGAVVSGNASALALTDSPGVGTALVEWFEARHHDEVAFVLTHGTPPEGTFVRLRGTDSWIALHAAGEAPEAAQVVLLRPATDERFVRAAVDTTADSTFVLGPDATNRWRSARLRERSGIPDEVAAEMSASERLHPEDMPMVFETFASAPEDRPVSVVARSRAVDDDERWETIEITLWNRVTDEVLGGYLVQVHNLDEGRVIDTPLSQADPGLLSLTDAAPVGIAVADVGGHIVYRNPRARELLGPDLESVSRGDWLERARPEYRPSIVAAFDAALNEGVESTLTAAFDGTDVVSPQWLRLLIKPQRSPNDKAAGVIATIEDVTEQTEARAELKAAELRMRHLATHDPLTGLPNRAALTDELDRAVARHARSAAGVAILFCDLDGFKPVNDRLGHIVGDSVLQAVAERLRSSVRETDFVARLGGDEFIVICEATGDTTAVIDDVVARLHDLVEQPISVGEHSATVGVSIGVAAVSPGSNADSDALLVLADAAMYEAKASGPGHTAVRWLGR